MTTSGTSGAGGLDVALTAVTRGLTSATGASGSATATACCARRGATPDQALGFCFFNYVSLPAATGNADSLAAIERIVAPAIRRFAPELILVSAGQDPSGVDPLARIAISANGFRLMAAAVAAPPDEVCAGRLVACHEGGYSQGYAPLCAWAAVEGLSGIRTPHEDPYEPWLGGMPCATDAGPAAATIERIAAQHGLGG